MATPLKKLKVSFYFDVISPYSYLAWVTLMRYKHKWNLDVEVKPFFLGGIMAGSGNKPPAMLPSRAQFQMMDLARSFHVSKIPSQPTPNNFFSKEVNKVVLSLQRLLTYLILEGKPTQEVETYVTRAFYSFHTNSLNRTVDNNLKTEHCEILQDVLGPAEKAENWLVHIESKRVKDQLNVTTKEALDLGAYGSPTMLVHGGVAPFYSEGKPMFFFGSDRFEQMALLCNLPYQGPCPEGADDTTTMAALLHKL